MYPDVKVYDSNGTQYTVNCPHFSVPKGIIILRETLRKNRDDRVPQPVQCNKHTHRVKKYHSTSVGRCLLCALRHGYAHKLCDTKQTC